MSAPPIAAADDDLRKEDVAWPHPFIAWYAVVLLSLANALSFIARTILSLLVDPVKADLGVSDTAISILHGFSFALVFAIIGLPISLLADRGNRRNIIAASIMVWSVMTVFCGATRTYAGMLVGRLGAGAGEGGFGPASQAILADFFPRKQQPLAMGVYSLGIYVGSGLALMLGGLVVQWAASAGPIVVPVLGEVKGWQIAFFLVGLPGIGLALLFLTVPEPSRQLDPADAGGPAKVSEIGAHLLKNGLVFTGLIIGLSLHVLVGFGAATWTPALLGRHFGLQPAEIGLIYGLIFLVCGLAGSVGGGMIASRLIERGVRSGTAWVAFVAYGIEVLFGIGYAFADTLTLAYTCIIGMNLFSAAALGAAFAVLNEITPNRMRAQVGAVFLFAINLIGAGAGPTVVAIVSETMFDGTFALANAIALTSLVAGIPAIVITWLLVQFYPRPARSGPLEAA